MEVVVVTLSRISIGDSNIDFQHLIIRFYEKSAHPKNDKYVEE